MYKKLTKKPGESWDDVARRVYGTPEKAGNISKMNNNIDGGNVLACEDETDAAGITGQVYIQSGDNLYNDFSEYTLYDAMQAVKGAVFIFNKTGVDYNFNFGDEVIIYDEKDKFLRGRVANIVSNLDNNLNWLQVEIKSHAGILAETNIAYPLEFGGLSIKEILTEVAGWYNQKISFSDENELNEIFTNEIGTSFTAKIDDTAWGFMQRICNSRGLILTDTGDGLFVGRYNAQTQEKINLVDGECLGIKKIKSNFVTVGLARYYETNTQYPQTDTAIITTPLPLPITKRYNSNDFNALDLKTAAQLQACINIGNHFTVNAEISENINVKSGDFAVVKNPKIKIDNEMNFIIESVERKHPDMTILKMVLPCKYTFEMPEELPLC
ncbi:MAG: hypothetical protein J5606_00165 [Bacteroidales bacterium]|jgi:hypothetical protein|nr:hypothetical protein [Bacteroidales bacterium]